MDLNGILTYILQRRRNMEGVISQIISALSPSALPVVVLCLGGLYLWFRFGRMEKDRQETKTARDNDSQEIHDKLLTHDFKLAELAGIVELHKDKLDSINKQLTIVNTELVKLNVQVEHLAKALERQNEIMLKQLNGVNNG